MADNARVPFLLLELAKQLILEIRAFRATVLVPADEEQTANTLTAQTLLTRRRVQSDREAFVGVGRCSPSVSIVR
jgi:hypothetical protein